MKKTLLIVLILSVSGLIWYLFIKEYDYQFQMEAKYGPGTVYQEIKNWKQFNPKYVDENIHVISGEPFKMLKQELESQKDNPVQFLWEFEPITDSTTQVTLNIKSEKSRFINRLAIINPFKNSIYIDSLKNRLLSFKKQLNLRQEEYAINIIDSVVMSPHLDCICHFSKNIPVTAKASTMVNSITFLEDYIIQHDLKLTGNPFVKIKRWDRMGEMIDFEFCFPVNLAQDIRPTENIEFRQIKSSSALKAIYNGNYRSSNLAWNDLLYKACEEGLSTNEQPLEIFFNNPKVEGNSAREWKAEIYLPILE